MLRWFVLATFLVLLSQTPSEVKAVPAVDGFYPVLAKFDGHSALSYPPSVALEFSGGATIEFWVYAGWTDNPGYDPAIMSYTGPNGPRWAFLVTADRKSFEIIAGSNASKMQADFSDRMLHHLAIIALGDSLEVLFDDLPIGTTSFGFADLPVSDLWIGAFRGLSYFNGQIGNIRIWDAALQPSALMEHSREPVYVAGLNAHPNVGELVGLSTFGNPETGGFVFFGTPNMVNPTIPLPPDPDASPADRATPDK